MPVGEDKKLLGQWSAFVESVLVVSSKRLYPQKWPILFRRAVAGCGRISEDVLEEQSELLVVLVGLLELLPNVEEKMPWYLLFIVSESLDQGIVTVHEGQQRWPRLPVVQHLSTVLASAFWVLKQELTEFNVLPQLVVLRKHTSGVLAIGWQLRNALA